MFGGTTTTLKMVPRMTQETLVNRTLAIPGPSPATARMIRNALCVAALGAMALTLSHDVARAQVAAVVNGEPITQLDIQHRTRLMQISGQKAISQKEVLDELIDDKLKVHLARRYMGEVPRREIDSQLTTMARRSGMNLEQFGKSLASAGISIDALRARIHADFMWTQIIRGKFKSSLQIGEKEVAVKMQGNTKGDGSTGFDYSLRPILFLVPRGASPAVYEARKREAESLRSRFTNCNEGLRLAMTLPDVAVRETITRQSVDFAQAQRDLLNNTPVGRLTPPDQTAQGIEVFAICNKRPVVGGDSPREREVRDTMFQERYQALSKKYLKELRAQALIEIRQ
jgi:peptidyl-prolyl cis-trans isomerase SurA